MLIKVLNSRYGLETLLQQKQDNKNNKTIIVFISIPLLKTFVMPYIHSSMYYKLSNT